MVGLQKLNACAKLVECSGERGDLGFQPGDALLVADGVVSNQYIRLGFGVFFG